jgi:hypothetical protein
MVADSPKLTSTQLQVMLAVAALMFVISAIMLLWSRDPPELSEFQRAPLASD